MRDPKHETSSQTGLTKTILIPTRPMPIGSLNSRAAMVYSAIDLRTHCSITSAIWSEFFSSIIMWPLP